MIGVGVRSVSYLTNVPADIRGRIQLVAVADISVKRRGFLPNASPSGARRRNLKPEKRCFAK